MIPYSMNPLGIGEYYTDLDILRQIRDANPTSQLPSLWLDTEDPYTQWEGVTWNEQKTKVTVLYVNSTQITKLTNVNKLTNLVTLVCYNNQLISLDVSGLKSLTFLVCYNNQLTLLNIEGLTSLSYLSCFSNQLESINVGELTELTYLACFLNQLTSLDVTGLNSLQTLECSNNKLTSLNISGLTLLTTLYCFKNKLINIPSLISKGSITEYDFTYNNFQIAELDRFRSIGFTDESKLLPQNT